MGVYCVSEALAKSARGAESVLRPKSVAVLGASTKGHGSGYHALVNVLSTPRSMDVHVVHPYADQIAGVPAVSDIQLLPAGVDLALVSLRADAVLGALEHLAANGCSAAMVPSAGLDPTAAAALREFARTSSMAVHGPNCMGVINVSDGFAPWFYDDTLTSQRPGPISLVSQSGSAAFLTRAVEGSGFSKIISTGNEFGLTTADYVAWLADDPDTTTVGLVLESIADVPSFVDAVALLRDAGKRAVVLKVGRTELGSAATRAHTGAIIGGDAGYLSLFERLDLPTVSDYDELAVVLNCLATPGMPEARGVRVGVVTDSGGESGLAADLSGRCGVQLPAFGEGTVAQLASANPGVAIANPFDAGASPTEVEGSYETSYDSIVSDPAVDSMLVIFEAHASLTPGELAYTDEHCKALVSTRARFPDKPILGVSSSSIATHPAFRERLGPSVPLLRGISNGFAAARALAANRRPVPRRVARPGDLPDGEIVSRWRGRIQAAIAGGRTSLDPAEAAALLDAYGLPFVESTVVVDAVAGARWATGRFPVAVKVSSADIAHRSDVGGVVLGVRGDEQLREAIDRIDASVRVHRPDAVVAGYELQRMAPDGGVEALLGFVADPVFGATVSVGTGGTLVELESDLRSSLTPSTRDEAARAISATRLGARLAGYRNLMPVTSSAQLAGAMVRLSWLASDMSDLVAACDLNPVVVAPHTGDMTIVDALVLLGPGTDRA